MKRIFTVGFALFFTSIVFAQTVPFPIFSKSFSPDTVPFGGRSTLTFTIDNTSVFGNTANIYGLNFTDSMPVGMQIASPANATTTCGTPPLEATLTAISGTSTISFSYPAVSDFPALYADSTCTISVDVVANAVGMLNNVSGQLTVTNLQSAQTTVGNASATLDVTVTPVALQKRFLDDPVPPGGNVTLQFIINNFDRNLAASDIAFTDNLASLNPNLAGLIFESVGSNSCNGTFSGVGTSNIAYSGGSLAAAGSCDAEVNLQMPGTAASGSYVNSTSAISATVGGSPVTGNQASDTLFVTNAPGLTKEFLESGTLAPDPVVNPGDDVVLRFTLSNSSSTASATSVSFIDELTDGSGGSPPDTTTGFLPFPVNVTLPPTPNPPCGAGSSLAVTFIDTDRQGLQLSNGVLDPGASCTFEVTITIPADMTGGEYLNTTEAPSAILDGSTFIGLPASDSLTVNAAPGLLKQFTDDPVTPGEMVTLEFTLRHSAEAATAATDITFSDDLSAVLTGLTAVGLPLAEACDPDGPGGQPGTGGLSGSAGDTSLLFTGGTLLPGESCVFSVDLAVPAGAPFGDYSNTTSEVSAVVAGLATTSAASSDVLQIASLVFTKEFLDNPVIAGDTSLLRFTIDNIHPTSDAAITLFTDSLSNALPGLAAAGAASVNTCGGVLTGTNTLNYSGGNVLAGDSCSIEVEVLVPAATANNSYTNVTSSLSANQGTAVVINPAVDTLVVNSTLLQLNKSFGASSAIPGGQVMLEFVLENLDPAFEATAIGFSDDLDAFISNASIDSELLNECGGTLAGVGTDMLTYSGGVLAAAASCRVQILIDVPANTAEGTYTNTSSSVSGTVTALTVTGDPAHADLDVLLPLVLSKSFAGPATAGGSVTLTFSITNPRANAVDGLGFTDDLNAFISGMTASSLPAAPCGAQSVVSGSSLVSFQGGSLAANGGMCSFDVEVSVPASAAPAVYSNTTSGLFANGLKAGDPATADLVIEPPPTFAKVFAPATIDAGVSSTLTFTIDNSASSLAAGNLAFTDNLPAGVVIATPAATSNTCSGTLSAIDGAATISFVGGSVAAGAACSILVATTSITGGQFVNTTGDLTSTSGNSGTASATLTVNPVADLVISKTDGVTEAVPGLSITYTIIASNNGPSEDPSATVTDVFPAGLTCTYTSVSAGGATGNTAAGAGNLAETLSMPSGSSVTYTAMCVIDLAATGTLNNSASITASITDPDSSNNTAVDDDTVIVAQADLSISKTDGVTSANPGDTITYTIVANNNGPSADPTASVVDAFPAGLTCTYTSAAAGGASGNTAAGSGDIADNLVMPSGSSVTYTADCVIDLSYSGVLSNTAIITASVADPDAGNNSATDNNTSVDAVADLLISKTDGVTTAVPGESVTYTIVASNMGPSDDPSVSVGDVFASELDCNYTSAVSGGASGNTAAGSGDLAETLTMPTGSSVTYTAVCSIDAAATGTLTNTATIAGAATDPDPGNNSATDNDTVLAAAADLSISKTDGVTAATPGGTITYTIVASNSGPSDDPAASVTDTFSSDMTCSYTSVAAGGASGNTAAGAGNLAETLSLPVGSSVTYTVDCTIDSAASGTLSNTATISASVTDPDMSNNSATDDDTVIEALADVSINMTTSAATINPGQSVLYTIVISNGGPSDDPLVTVTDMFPADLTCSYTSVNAGGASGNTAAGSGNIADSLSMPAGSSVTYTADCLVADSASGDLTNVATITTSITDPAGGNNTASSVIRIAVLSVTEPIPAMSEQIMLLLMLMLAGVGAGHLRFKRG